MMFAAIHVPGITADGRADLVAVARSFSPSIELATPDTVVLPVGGLRKLIGPPHQIASEIARRAAERNLAGNIGIAANIDTAILAARNLTGVTIIPKGAEPKYIGDFRIETLPIQPETFEVLCRWGIHTLEDFAALPDDGIHERLGPAALHLLQLSRGTTERPLRPICDSAVYEEKFELEYPVEFLEPLLFILGRLVNELCSRLDHQSMATTEVKLRLDHERAGPSERALQLPFATRDGKMILKLLQHDLEAHPPSAPVVLVTLAVTPVDPRIVQHGLFIPPSPEPEKLELTLTKIRSMVGQPNAGAPQLLDTYRPNAWRMTAVSSTAPALQDAGARPQLAFRHFTPVLEARVELQDLRPTRIFAGRVYGNVILAAGPWRTSGDWWRNTVWDRDEWDIGLNDGVLYRLCLARPNLEWFLEGAYD